MIENTFEMLKPYGHVIWAYKVDKPAKNVFLVNFWKQQVVKITDYDILKGTMGTVIQAKDNNSDIIINWPPYCLEAEILANKWQPVVVSENILNNEILKYIPAQMGKAIWEIILLLLVSPENQDGEYSALLDTGLSPSKGLISYIRLLNKIKARSTTWNDVPSYLQIFANEIQE